jgi:hypothetical protein
MKVELDHKGLAEILKSAGVAKAVRSTAESVADAVNVDAEVEVNDYTTDRAASAVTVKDVRAMGWQARDGLLTRAAAAVGLEVKSK